MRFEPRLSCGRLVRRYRRFLADILCDAGGEITAHCPNTGSLRGLTTPGIPVAFSHCPGRNRKYAHTWELAKSASGSAVWIGIHTGRTNAVVAEAIGAGRIQALARYARVEREIRCGSDSRLDLRLSAAGRRPCYVEVKSVHMVRRPELAEFPDAVTARGAKHVRALASVCLEGARAVMFYLIQRDDVAAFQVAGDIDPAYAKACAEARNAGVEMLAMTCSVGLEDISPARMVPVSL